MIPGPTIIKKCSACFKPILEDTLVSGNNFGTRRWTDGKEDSMFSHYLWLVMCPRCHSPLWIDELEKIGEIKPWDGWPGKFTRSFETLSTDELEKLVEIRQKEIQSGEFKGPLPYTSPSSDDYFAMLERGAGNLKKEKYVRRHAWWAGNDQRRNERDRWAEDNQEQFKNEEIPMTSRELLNLAALTEILDESDFNDLFFKAEAMRELGRFDDALSILAKVGDENVMPAARFVRGLCEKKNVYVQEMRLGKY